MRQLNQHELNTISGGNPAVISFLTSYLLSESEMGSLTSVAIGYTTGLVANCSAMLTSKISPWGLASMLPLVVCSVLGSFVSYASQISQDSE